MVIYASACQDCGFTFESGCDATTHHIAERHATVCGHEVVYGSYDERNRPFTQELARAEKADPDPDEEGEIEDLWSRLMDAWLSRSQPSAAAPTVPQATDCGILEPHAPGMHPPPIDLELDEEFEPAAGAREGTDRSFFEGEEGYDTARECRVESERLASPMDGATWTDYRCLPDTVNPNRRGR